MFAIQTTLHALNPSSHFFSLNIQPFLRNQSNDLNEDIPIQPEARDEKHITRADAIQSNKLPQSTDTDTTTIQQRHPPLRFVFSGYSLWLELEQQDIDDKGRGDLDRAMIDAADRFSLGGAIPSPHVTALYGICTIDNEEEMRRMFREDVKQILVNVAEKQRRTDDDGGGGDDSAVSKKQSKKDCDSVELWPDLDAIGIIVGTEFDGVDGGTMVRGHEHSCLSSNAMTIFINSMSPRLIIFTVSLSWHWNLNSV